MLKAPWRVLLPLLFPRLYSNCFSLAPLFTALTGTTRPPPWPAGGVRPRLLGCPRLLQEGALCCPADRSCSLHWRCSSCSRWRCAAASRSWRWHCSSCPCRRRAAASHFLRCAQFVQHLSSSLHCCCCFTSRTHLHTGLVFFTHPPPHRLTKLPLLPLPASKNVSFSPRPATLLFLAPCFLTRRRRCWGWAGPPRQVSTRPTGKLSAYEPAPPMLAAVAPPMLAAAVAPLFFSGSAHWSHRYNKGEKARSECGRWDMACRGALYFLRLSI